MDAVLKFAVDYFIIDGAIGLMAIFGISLIAERVKALYFTYSINANEFMGKILKLVEDDKIDEAIAFCGANQAKPLAFVAKKILERSDRDEKAIEASLDIAAGEVAPNLTRNLGYLAMCSNVVTLIGLLGTVVGLIMSFKAVSFADPSQKQTLLADGISMAMHATMAGLMVAIPVMICYSFLHARQGKLFSEIDQSASRLIDFLKSRDFNRFDVHSVYPSGVGMAQKKTSGPPAHNVKAI